LKFLLALLADHAMSASASNIFLLAGQSNMSGRGGNYNDSTSNTVRWDGQIPPECRSKPEILQLAANKSWVEAHEPLHQEIDHWKTCGIGPGMPFANAILDKYPSFGSIGLVPCAKGGTRIMEWAKGTELYNQLVSRAKASLTGGGKIRALLWYQGESDTAEQDAKLYKSRLEKFFNDVRHDLNYPDLPIIMVRILYNSIIIKKSYITLKSVVRRVEY
jgi:hypothetical protein